jgi:hypothetical protein
MNSANAPPEPRRFMRSFHGARALLTDHEPEMRKCLEINERISRFMERKHLQNLDVSWGHEPGRVTRVRAPRSMTA